MKLIRTSLLLLVCLGFAQASTAQNFDYFGVKTPGETPERFPFEKVISTEFSIRNPVFSPDGQEFYFADDNSKTIQVMRRTADGWAEPETASFSAEGFNSEPFITRDNKTIYFISTRPPGSEPFNNRIWHAKRQQDGTWSAPELVLHRETDQGFWYPVSIESGVLYFGATLEDSFGQGDFYRARETAEGWDIEHLPPPFNTPDFEWDPYFAHDGSYMIFQSRRPDGFGETDIYISFREGDAYGAPINVGTPINSPIYETAATITPDGNYMFYTVVGPGHPSQVYWVSTTALTKLKNIKN